jgi:hypothetical protein
MFFKKVYSKGDICERRLGPLDASVHSVGVGVRYALRSDSACWTLIHSKCLIIKFISID